MQVLDHFSLAATKHLLKARILCSRLCCLWNYPTNLKTFSSKRSFSDMNNVAHIWPILSCCLSDKAEFSCAFSGAVYFVFKTWFWSFVYLKRSRGLGVEDLNLIMAIRSSPSFFPCFHGCHKWILVPVIYLNILYFCCVANTRWRYMKSHRCFSSNM